MSVLVVDPKKVNTLVKMTGVKNINDILDLSLNETIRMYKQRNLLKLRGKLNFDNNVTLKTTK